MADSALKGEGVCVSLGGTTILRDLSLELEFGHFTVIAGPNGAGKSTLLRALLGLLPRTAGRVFCQGLSLDQMSRVQRAQALGYVPQRSLLDAAMAVEDVVAQGRFAKGEAASRSRKAAHAALERVGIEHLALRSFVELSGGERRLVLVARALCGDAKILCFDEPTSCLDIANRLLVLELMHGLAKEGYAVLCVLHELEDVRRYADRVCLLNEGEMHASGRPDEVIVAEQIASVYKVQMLENDAVGFRLPGASP